MLYAAHKSVNPIMRASAWLITITMSVSEIHIKYQNDTAQQLKIQVLLVEMRCNCNLLEFSSIPPWSYRSYYDSSDKLLAYIAWKVDNAVTGWNIVTNTHTLINRARNKTCSGSVLSLLRAYKLCSQQEITAALSVWRLDVSVCHPIYSTSRLAKCKYQSGH